MIALGLLLAVVALRMLQGRAQRERIVSALLCGGMLGGGLVVAGLGVSEVVATNDTIVPVESECTTGGTQPYVTQNRTDGRLQNDCPNALTITGYSLNCDVSEVEVQVSPVGTEIPSGEAADLNYCELVFENAL